MSSIKYLGKLRFTIHLGNLLSHRRISPSSASSSSLSFSSYSQSPSMTSSTSSSFSTSPAYHSQRSVSTINIPMNDLKFDEEITQLSSIAVSPDLTNRYISYKHHFKNKIRESHIDPNGVFANNELDLSEIKVYGFDYDYTLAVYKESLHYLIYNLGRDVLINKYKYPKGIKSFNYIPDFAIRGLHYDIEHGLLTKIDSFHQIQLGCVYRGFSPLSDEEVTKIYGGCYISQSLIKPEDDHPKMKQLNDLFSVPEICLLANVTEYFIRSNIPYCPEILFYDVQAAVQSIHPVMHQMLDRDRIGDYLEKRPELTEFLHRLRVAKKKMFLITNSPFDFVDCGMRYMIGHNWADLFDIIIVRARKPKFFNQSHRPFRSYQPDTDSHTWEEVTRFEKGKVYMEGTVKKLLELTGWHGNNILYFGDQIYADLADLTLFHGWRTGAVIGELENEINILNSEEFAEAISELQGIQQLIDERQRDSCILKSPLHAEDLLQYLFRDREILRLKSKSLFNPQFGSIFRTHHNPSYFSRRLFRYSDIYMSHITNLLNYSVNHIFCPRRGSLPHEKMYSVIKVREIQY
ncbi:5'-nucleotidase domain-containing protein 3 [Tetranychus urticae]|uniref:5'-nucleotidase domain-containing protein 3 n=1 Tax=Tetranychus urticae TaxID=32264 RepID=T1KGU5_TETUR|nr:5'-nucleotidase domain-containing protein 3 [Tetranychus urticae]